MHKINFDCNHKYLSLKYQQKLIRLLNDDHEKKHIFHATMNLFKNLIFYILLILSNKLVGL
jgi:hypothetical protein